MTISKRDTGKENSLSGSLDVNPLHSLRLKILESGNRMKQRIINIVLVLFFLAGFGITMYPVFSDWYISHHQGQVVENYDKKAAEMSQKEIDEAFEKAREYNKELLGNVVLTDPFDPAAVEKQNEDYDNLLNIAGDGVMGSVEIPSINVYLPIYHGTDSESLEKGAGHLEDSSLPVGGKGTHSIISAHTGLPSAKMFDDLTEVKIGDVFYIHVLNRTLAYEVNQIKVVLPENISDLLIDKDKDYVTLVTCTPYGINSHRLLVRGTRIPYREAKKKDKDQKKSNNMWKAYLLAAVLGVVLIILLWYYFRIRPNKRKRKAKKRRVRKNEK